MAKGYNRLGRQTSLSGNLACDGSPGGSVGPVKLVLTGTVARTDTAAKNLFKIPGESIIVNVRIWTAVLSDAVTTATVSVGKTGANTQYVNAFDVKGGTLKAQNEPVASNLFAAVGSAGTAVQIVGIYAESGGASTTGGPFNVAVEYYIPLPS